MRLHDKVEPLRALRPDVAVVPECACPEVLLRRALELDATDFAWEGANPRKGLAVLAFGSWRLRKDRAHRPRVGTTLPVHLSGPAAVRLLAVWALPRWGHRPWGAPPEPLPEGIDRLASFLASGPAIVAGDFNRTLVARRGNGTLAPSALARRLEARGFVSAYHLDRRVARWQEREPTLFLHRRLPGRHHVDHVFLDAGTAADLRGVEVGGGPDWIRSSDHAPLIVEVEVSEAAEGGVVTLG